MTEQKRWHCLDCEREFIDPEPAGTGLSIGIGVLDETGKLRPWEPDRDGCRGCGSLRIELVKYRPAFSGADLPRDGQVEEPAVTKPAAVTPPPLPLVADVNQVDVWQLI